MAVSQLKRKGVGKSPAQALGSGLEAPAGQFSLGAGLQGAYPRSGANFLLPGPGAPCTPGGRYVLSIS